MARETITIELEGTPSEIKAQKKALETIAKLPVDDRIRLLEIAENPKALDSLSTNWEMLKRMF